MWFWLSIVLSEGPFSLFFLSILDVEVVNFVVAITIVLAQAPQIFHINF